MRILVTGGAGFIGSALIRHLIGESEHDVLVYDKLTYAGVRASRAPGALPVQVSTDHVFAGDKPGPYLEVGPLGVYGASKLAGEYAARLGNPRSVVLRTAWVLSAHRGNFLNTMLRLAAPRRELTVVSDQFGCPTGAGAVADIVTELKEADA